MRSLPVPDERGPARSQRAVAVLASLVALTACSGESAASRPTVATRPVTTVVADTPFCDAAVEFNDYLDQEGAAVFVPTLAPGYLDEVQLRLSLMIELAPDEAGVDGVALSADIETIRSAYAGLSDDLAAVDFDVFALDGQSFVSERGTEASVRLDDYLFDQCGFDPLATLPFEGQAPEVLSDEELADLVEGDDDAEVVRSMAEQFEVEFGLDPAAANCLAENMDRDSVIAISSGAAITPEVADDFAATLEACGLDAEDVGG